MILPDILLRCSSAQRAAVVERGRLVKLYCQLVCPIISHHEDFGNTYIDLKGVARLAARALGAPARRSLDDMVVRILG